MAEKDGTVTSAVAPTMLHRRNRWQHACCHSSSSVTKICGNHPRHYCCDLLKLVCPYTTDSRYQVASRSNTGVRVLSFRHTIGVNKRVHRPIYKTHQRGKLFGWCGVSSSPFLFHAANQGRAVEIFHAQLLGRSGSASATTLP